MNPTLLIIACILLPFAGSVLALLGGKSLRFQQAVGILAFSLALAASCALLKFTATGEIATVVVGGWKAPYGITLAADILSAMMLVVCNLVALGVAIYSLKGLSVERQTTFFWPLLLILMFGVSGSFVTTDLFNLFVWFEVMLLSSFVLMSSRAGKSQSAGAIKYVVLNLIASTFFLCGAGLLYGKVGTLNMADLAVKLGENDSMLVQSSAAMLFIAYAIKSAVFPFFFWLPASYHTAPIPVSALFAGLLTKVGVYAFMRTGTLFVFTGDSNMERILMVAAILTMVTGVLGAASQFAMRKVLSFHIISQVGYMMLGLALNSTLAIAGAIFYIFHHIIVKSNLFLITGAVEHSIGTSDLSKTGGLYKKLPWLAMLFLIPALSLAGIPPLSGFWAKFVVLKASLDSGEWIAAVAVLAVGLLTLFSMTKIWNEVFWKKVPEGEERELKKIPATMLAPIVALAICTVVIGLFGNDLFKLSEQASEQLLDPQPYIEAVLNPNS